MTALFLMFALIAGWSTWNLYKPVTDHPRLCVVSFLVGWLTGELALHHIAWQVLLVFLFIWNGALEGLAAATGFLIFAASWLGMGYFYLSGEKAARATQQALTTGLGKDYEKKIKPELRAGLAAGPDWNRIKLPFTSVSRRVEVIKDIGFGDHGQTLDIYRPRHSLTKSPVLFQIHGGAWTRNMGSKNEQALPLMAHMAERDWICVSTDYRLCPQATFPEHMIDCKQALKWIKENIADYGGDPGFIVVTGGSAGGHLAALLALSPNDPAFQPGFEDLDTTVQGAVTFYGVYDLTDSNRRQRHDAQRQLFENSLMKRPRDTHLAEYEEASPLFRAGPDAPPFFIIHGDMDSLVPVEEARDFAAKLNATSKQPVVYAEIEGAQHAFDMFPSLRSEHTKNSVERFLAYVYSNRAAAKRRSRRKAPDS